MRPETRWCGVCPGTRRRAGTTLVELVVAIVVVAIALGGTLHVFGASFAGSADALVAEQGTAIARAYLEEILTKDFAGPSPACPPPEPSRSLYDTVCDYQGLDDAGVRDQQGAAVPGLGAYRVRVAVDGAVALAGLTGPDEVVRVDVRVTRGSALDLTLSGYRTSR